MGRKPIPQPLRLDDAADTAASPADDLRAGETLPITTPSDTRSPRSPRSPFRFAQKKHSNAGVDVLTQQQRYRDEAQYAPISAALHQPVEPPNSQLLQPHAQQHISSHGQRRVDDEKSSKSSFFFFGKSSKSSDRLAAQPPVDHRGEIMSRDSDFDLAPSRQNQGSAQADSAYLEPSAAKAIPSMPSKSDVSLASSNDYDNNGSSKKGKPKPFALLSRSRSIKDKENSSPQDSAASTPVKPVEVPRDHSPAGGGHLAQQPLRTAPLHAHDRSFRDMMSSAVRNHSAERPQARGTSGHRDASNHRDRGRDLDREQSRTQPTSYKDNSGSGLFSGLKNSSSKAADLLSKGLFGKNTRSGSTTEKEPIVDDEHYVIKILNLPLVEQARRTRISKRLEESRDKTEFWMPAFPWRAIDYLNYKGSDVEGLYRVPGSGPQIKKWQRRFDEEGDVDLFAQQDLYDINIIGSMLKAWLRELPDELFPKESQDKIARECAGAETVPQLLIDELSNLSPFNYYLLFAITCHLSLLLAHSDKNKMDFRNLCICFQPCMKIDAFCFKFLVCDWRDCWKGCKNEAQYIEEEYALFDQPPPRSISQSRRTSPENGQQQHQQSQHPPQEQAQPQVRPPPQAYIQPQGQVASQHSGQSAGYYQAQAANQLQDEPNYSSSDSVKQAKAGGGADSQKARLRKKGNATGENGSPDPNANVSSHLTINSERETPQRGSDLRPLSPIKPLSPLGF